MIFSSKLRNCKVTPNKTKCLVEVTPEHHAQHRQNQSQHSSPAISIGSQRLTNLRPNSNVSQRQIISQDHSENHQNDQDLIQRVSELNSARIQLKNNIQQISSVRPQLQPQKTTQQQTDQQKQFQEPQNYSPTKQKQQPHCDQDFIQLCSLVKDKLNREGISLAAPPFTTKVRSPLFQLLTTNEYSYNPKKKILRGIQKLRGHNFGLF